MKTLLESFTTGTAGQPIGAETLDFIQGAYNDPIGAILRSLIGTYTTNDKVIIEGCAVTTGSPTAPGACVIAPGYIYYNGNWYYTSGFNATITGSNVVVGTITTTDAVGPITFTDNNTYSVHEVKTIVLSQAATGSFDFSTFKRPYNGRSILSATASSQTITSNTPTWADLTSITATTPSDRDRMYMIFFKCRIDENNSSVASFAEFQLLQGSTQLDQTSAGKSNAATTDVFLIPVNLVYVGLIPANTIIKVQARRTTADCTAYDMKLYAVEIF